MDHDGPVGVVVGEAEPVDVVVDHDEPVGVVVDEAVEVGVDVVEAADVGVEVECELVVDDELEEGGRQDDRPQSGFHHRLRHDHVRRCRIHPDLPHLHHRHQQAADSWRRQGALHRAVKLLRISFF